jgi:uncharacterized protein
MNLADASRYLLDVNVLVAILDEDHVHHEAATRWFDTPGLRWAICPFTEAGLLRYMTRPKTGDMSMEEAAAMLAQLKQEPGYHYQSIFADWFTLSGPFFKRLFGHNQVTDSYLLGLAIQDGLVLATFDRAMLHLAGEHCGHVLILEAN